MFGGLLRSAWFSLPCKEQSPAAAPESVSPIAAQIESNLVARKAARAATRLPHAAWQTLSVVSARPLAT